MKEYTWTECWSNAALEWELVVQAERRGDMDGADCHRYAAKGWSALAWSIEKGTQNEDPNNVLPH